jgi:hypothetical protein
MASAASKNDIKNPFGFRLVSEAPKEIPNSPLVQVGLAISGGQYYAAATDPVSKKCYVLHANINESNPKKDVIYKEILDPKEWNIACAFFKAVGIFELFYKGTNWIFTRKNRKDIVPVWFRERYDIN